MRKKFLQGVTSLGIAAAICMACGVVTASAATLAKDDITINYATQKILVDVDGTDDNQVIFGVSSVNARKVLKTAAWEVYDVPTTTDEDGVVTKDGVVSIDISSLNTQKDNYVQIKGDQSSDPITLYIPATDKKIKLKFDAATGKIVNNKGTDDATYEFEYRTQYSDWSYFGKFDSKTQIDLSAYQQRGATLYLRLKSKAQTVVEDEDEGTTTTLPMIQKIPAASETNTGIKDADNQDLKEVYKLESLPGKEVKVTVAKKANGPKITINYVKGTVSLPKGVKWRVNGNVLKEVEDDDTGENITVKEWKMGTFTTTATSAKYDLTADNDEKVKNEVAKLFNGGNIEAYIDNSAKKKADSKITHIDVVNDKATLEVTGDTTNVHGNKIGEDIEASVTEVTGRTPSFTLEVKNKNTDKAVKYQVVLSDSATAVSAAEAKKAKAIAGGKSFKQAKVADGKYVWISKVGDAKSQTWTTDYVLLGKVVAKAAEPESEDQKALKAFADFVEGKKVTKFTCGSNGSEVTIFSVDDVFDDGIDWGNPAKYTYDDKTIEGVTITVTKVEGDGASYIGVTDGMLKVTARPTTSQSGEATVTVTFAKDGCTPVTKTITATASR